MIRFNVFFQAKAGKYSEALELTLQLVAESQKHEGCIAYDVFESGTRKDVFMLCETWASWDAHAAHIATASFKELMPKIEALGLIKAEHFEIWKSGKQVFSDEDKLFFNANLQHAAECFRMGIMMADLPQM